MIGWILLGEALGRKRQPTEPAPDTNRPEIAPQRATSEPEYGMQYPDWIDSDIDRAYYRQAQEERDAHFDHTNREK